MISVMFLPINVKRITTHYSLTTVAHDDPSAEPTARPTRRPTHKPHHFEATSTPTSSTAATSHSRRQPRLGTGAEVGIIASVMLVSGLCVLFGYYYCIRPPPRGHTGIYVYTQRINSSQLLAPEDAELIFDSSNFHNVMRNSLNVDGDI